MGNLTITPGEVRGVLNNPKARKPKGFLVSPYSFLHTIRFFLNRFFNGLLTYKNPDLKDMTLLSRKNVKVLDPAAGEGGKTAKIAFLGDVMVSKDGKLPELSNDTKTLLTESDIIIVNVEGPVIPAGKKAKRGLFLKLDMSADYLKTLYDVNPEAKWVFNVANNHACDGKEIDGKTVVERTVANIKAAIPNAEVVGTRVESSSPVLTLQIEDGPRIGIVGWTGVMNKDRKHLKERSGQQVLRDTDITPGELEMIKSENGIDMLVGSVHDNEEQSMDPIKEVRDKMLKLMGKDKFDVIVGHGPHVVHPGEETKEGMIFHSTGNFCSPGGPSQTNVGLIPQITVEYTNKKVAKMTSKVNFTQQGKTEDGKKLISLIEPGVGANFTEPPKNFKRIARIWPTVFQEGVPLP